MKTRTKPVRAMVALMLLAVPAAVAAQPATGSRIDRSKQGMTGFHDPRAQKSPRAAINAIGRCKAENNRFRALKTLGYAYLSDEQTKSLKYIYKAVDYRDPCYIAKQISYGFSTAPAVGAFAEFFLTKKYDEQDVFALGQLSDTDWQQAAMQPRTAEEFFGRCVVQSGRDQIYTLVKTIPDTEQESAAITALVPLLGPCVTDGLEVSFDKTSLRAMLAQGLYQAVRQQAEMTEAAE